MAIAIACVLLAALVVALNQFQLDSDRDGGWHEYSAPLFRKIVLINGKPATKGSTIARRWVGSQWQYREMTGPELQTHAQETEW